MQMRVDEKWILAVGLLIAVPIGVLIGLLISPARLADLETTPSPVVESAQLTQFDQRVGVAVTPQWADGVSLFAPEWSGVVGRVDVQSGAVLRTGDPIASVAGLTRIAVATPEPFYRRLSLGDGGTDVTWLHRILSDLGYLTTDPPDPSEFSDQTLEGIASLGSDLGASAPSISFEPAWFVWLPEEPFNVSSSVLVPGAPAPQQGTTIVSGPMRLQAVDIQPLEGGPLVMDAGVPYVLAVSGVEVPLTGESAEVSDDGMAALAGLLDPSADSVGGTVHRAAPVPVWALPSTAVVAGEDGELCVWTNGSGSYLPVAVEVVAARAGVTFIEPAAADQPLVLHNPAEVLDDPACPSS